MTTMNVEGFDFNQHLQKLREDQKKKQEKNRTKDVSFDAVPKVFRVETMLPIVILPQAKDPEEIVLTKDREVLLFDGKPHRINKNLSLLLQEHVRRYDKPIYRFFFEDLKIKKMVEKERRDYETIILVVFEEGGHELRRVKVET